MAVSGWRRVVFLVFNSLFLAVGATTYALSVWILVTTDVQNKLDINGMLFTYSVLGASTFIVFIGIFGCVGGALESLCLLKTYVALQAILFVLEIGATIAVHLALERNLVEEPAWRGWQELGSPQRDLIQTQLQCCGYRNGTAEYQDIPSSCHNETSGVVVTEGSASIWQSSCKDKIDQWFSSNVPVWVTVIVLVVVIQLVSALLSCCVLQRVEAACRVRPQDPGPPVPVSEEKKKPPSSVYVPKQPIPAYNPSSRRRLQAVTDPEVRERLAKLDF